MIGLVTKIKSIFKMARVVAVSDATDLRNGWFVYEGSERKGTLWTPYGIMHNPPIGSIAMLFAQNGQESNAIGIADAPAIRVIRDMQAGEVAIGNYITGSYTYYKANGDVDTYSPADVNVTANGDINATATNISATASGNIQATAGGNINMTATGSVTINANTFAVSAPNGGTFTVGNTTIELTDTGIAMTGDVDVTGDVSADGISLKTHVHGGVTAGAALTGEPE